MRSPVGPNFVNGNQPLIKRCSNFLESLSRWGWSNAETEPLLEQQPVVRIGDHSKSYVEREVRIAPQVLAFFEQGQQKFEPRQAVQIEAALGFIES